MIPKNISKEAVLKAMEEIDLNGIPKKRDSTKYMLKNGNKLYPPKYTISLANKFVNGIELKPSEFSGGDETNSFLINLGFKILGCSNADQANAGKTDTDSLRIACVVLMSRYRTENDACTEILESVLTRIDDSIDVVLFPAGFYTTEKPARSLYKQTTMTVQKILKSLDKNCTVCIGIDGRKDQMAIAIDNSGIIALARKFHPTDGEEHQIKSAEDYLSNEDKYSRIFKIGDMRFYLAVCYDSLGIRQKSLDNPGVEVVLNPVHGFYPKGESNSGDVYFAKHGFAGASKQWGCYVFGAARFVDRKIPKNWPSGVYWNQGSKSTSIWKYEDNGIKPYDRILIDDAVINIYEINNQNS